MVEEIEDVVAEVPVKSDLLAQANDAAKRLEDANKKMEGLIRRQEELAAQRVFSGEADVTSPKVNPEDKAKADAKALIAGSGFEDMID